MHVSRRREGAVDIKAFQMEKGTSLQTMTSTPDSTGKLDSLPRSVSMSERLNCPLCLQQYKTPRTLACLHTFCEACISSHIVEAAEKTPGMTAVECPVCGTPSDAPSPGKPPGVWAQHLPLNFAIASVLESMGTESGRQKACDNCARKTKSVAAESYCKDCRQYQCSDCVGSHNRLAVLEGHLIVSLEDLAGDSPVDLGKLEYCAIHLNEPIRYFCKDHGTLCCSSCAIVRHRGCKHVQEVKDLGQAVKKGEKSKQLQTDMESLQTNLSEITEALESNSEEIENEAKSVVRQMTDVRNQMVQVFDDLIAEVSSKCQELKNEYSTEIADTVLNQRSLTAAMSSSHILMESVLKQGNDTQIFITFRKLKNQLDDYRKLVKRSWERSSIIEFKLELEKELEALMKSTTSLASVTVKRSRQTLKDPTASQARPVADCVVEKVPLVDIQKRGELQPGYTGANYLLDGSLVAADFNNSLCCLLDGSYNVTADLQLSSPPTDLAIVGDDEVAFVLPEVNTILIVAIRNKLKLAKTLPCDRKPWCVARADNSDELAVGWESGFSLLSLNGEETNYVSTDESGQQIQFSEHDRLAVDNKRSRVYQSKWSGNTVYCYGLDGKVIFTFSEHLNCPSGLALDRDNNVYICSYLTRCVLQVCPAGTTLNIINTDMYDPYTVCFHPNVDEMLVMNWDTTNVLKVKFVPVET